MRFRGIPVSIIIISILFLSCLSLLSTPVTATYPTVGFIGVSGSEFTKDGIYFASNFHLIGVDDTTAWAMAIRAYIENIPSAWGQNMNFPEPNGKILNVDNLTELWSSYFWFMDYYGLNLVRFSSGDEWATDICYRAYVYHETQYYEVLESMAQWASYYGIYFELNMAGGSSGDVPNYFYDFEGSGQVTTHNHTAGSTYQQYLNYISDTIAYLDGSTYTNAVFAYDVYNEPDSSPFWNHDQVAFRTWAREIANDTCPLTTHIVDMGVGAGGDLAGNFGWGLASFQNATGLTGFDICHRHDYGSAEDNYLVSDPLHWSTVHCGKPLFVGEVAKSYYSSGQWYTLRWTWWESTFLSLGGQAYCNLLLTPTFNYPYSAPPSPIHSEITSVVLYHDNTIIANFTEDYQAVTFVSVVSITSIDFNVRVAGIDNGFGLETTIHLLGTDPGPGWVGLFYAVSTTGFANGTIYDYTFNHTFTQPFFLNTSGIYEVVTKNDYHVSIGGPEINFQTWNDALIYSSTGSIVSYIPDRFGISANIVYFAWLLIIFLPGLILNSVIPKIGFIAGIIIMSLVLTISNVINSWWVFLVLMMGILILIFRGDE